MRRTTILASCICAVVSAAWGRVPSPSGLVDDDGLAFRIEKTLEEKFLDGNGVLGCVRDKSDITVYDEKGFYENASMVQGAFLAAMCAKYRATKDRTALDKARRTFRGIRKIYDLSRPGGEGYYCKPWDWRFQDETSSDQYVYAMMGLDAFRELADPEECDQIREMLTAMARFWIDRKYRYRYLGRMLDWQQCRFVSFMAYARRVSEAPVFADELSRLLDSSAATSDIPFRASLSLKKSVRSDGLVVYEVDPEAALAAWLSLWPAVQDGPRCAYYDHVMQEVFDFVVNSLAPDGTSYSTLVRREDGRYVEMDPSQTLVEPEDASDPRWNALLYRTIGPYRYGGRYSAAGVATLVLMAPYFRPADEWVRTNAAVYLDRIAAGPFTSVADPHHVLPADYVRKFVDRPRGEGYADWLLAYWTLAGRSKTTAFNDNEKEKGGCIR